MSELSMVNDAAKLFATALASQSAHLVDASEVAVFYISDPEAPTLESFAHLRKDPCTAELKARALGEFEKLVTEGFKRGRGGYFKLGRPNMWCLIVFFDQDSSQSFQGAILLIVYTPDEADIVKKMALLTHDGGT